MTVPFGIEPWYYGTTPLSGIFPPTPWSPPVEDAPEKSRRDLLLGMIQSEFPAYHPLVSIARIAHHGDADLKVQLECHKTIAKYVEPELKSIEVKGEITGRHRVSVSLFEPVEAGLTPIEGSAVRVLGSGNQGAKVLPGGAVIDDDPVVVDRVVQGW